MSQKAKNIYDIEFESNIVWLMDVNSIPYVREHFETSCSRRKGKIKYQNYTIVGYAELEANAPNTGKRGCFAKRVFWLKEYDHFRFTCDSPNGFWHTIR